MLFEYMEENFQQFSDIEKAIAVAAVEIVNYATEKEPHQIRTDKKSALSKIRCIPSIGRAFLSLDARSRKEDNKREILISMIEYLLPELNILGVEHPDGKGGRMDLLCWDITDDRHVIIELKSSTEAEEEKGIDQLCRYRKNFDKKAKCLLISNSSPQSKKIDDSLSWYDIGIVSQRHIKPPSCWCYSELTGLSEAMNLAYIDTEIGRCFHIKVIEEYKKLID